MIHFSSPYLTRNLLRFSLLLSESQLEKVECWAENDQKSVFLARSFKIMATFGQICTFAAFLRLSGGLLPQILVAFSDGLHRLAPPSVAITRDSTLKFQLTCGCAKSIHAGEKLFFFGFRCGEGH